MMALMSANAPDVVVKVIWDIWQICCYHLKNTPVINCKASVFFKGDHFITAGAPHVVANNSQLSKWWRGTARNLVLVKQEQYCFLSPRDKWQKKSNQQNHNSASRHWGGIICGWIMSAVWYVFYQAGNYSGINVGHFCVQFGTINWSQISK